MNCSRFNDQIYDYLDGTLPKRTQAAIEKHLANCSGCRQALDRERMLARSLSNQFRLAAKPLKLPPEFSRRVQAALADNATKHHDIPARGAIPGWLWPVAMAASLALVAFILAGHLMRNPAEGPGSDQPLPMAAVDTFSIDVSYTVPTYTFLREDSRVIDTLTSQTTVVKAALCAADHAPKPGSDDPKRNL